MASLKSIAILSAQRSVIDKLKSENIQTPAFITWRRDTEVAIEKIFGESSKQVRIFTDIKFYPDVHPTSPKLKAEIFVNGLVMAEAILSSLIREAEVYLVDSDNIEKASILNIIEGICLKFHRVAQQISQRHGGRSTILIEDEYDVQDMMHAILRLHFDDIRPEEWAPSYAGGSSRMDFLLKDERVVIETKKTRRGLTSKTVGEELLIDIARYDRHPDCDFLVCFVYDPEGRVKIRLAYKGIWKPTREG
ncbi:hypothetical protein [Rhizobium sp. RCAM05973]|uniref:PD-(D/E)XK nuclease domain-containing protein n=1 Tax=Rhizobium sp. RCAM05973 TaxID=2994066 RepID=UPI0022EBB1B0|nr:hypothetical protein [Rhizobium sp. RCAM05973]